MTDLREYQDRGVAKARMGWQSGAISQMIMAPPGAGKTHTALHLIRCAVAKGRRAFFIVDSLLLLEQVVQRLMREGVPVGVIQANHQLTDIRQPVQVCMVQSLATRWDEIISDPSLRPDVIVGDEEHILYKTKRKIIADCRLYRIPYLGLSATPFSKGLGQYFDRLIILATADELIAQGDLVPTIVKAPFIPDFSSVPTVGGRPDANWVKAELAKVMCGKSLVDNAVQHWLEHGESRKTLGYAVNTRAARAFAAECRRSGIEADFIDSHCEPDLAVQKLAAYERGDLAVVWSVGMLIKGYDSPSTSCIVDAAPTRSWMRHLQKMGRGARPFLGKENLLYFDHAGNVLLNGLPTDPMPSQLDDGRTRSISDRKITRPDESPLLVCSNCAVISRGAVCSHCGSFRSAVEVPDHAAGQLAVLSQDPFQKVKQKSKKEILSEEDCENIYGGLLMYANAKQRNMLWVDQAYKKRTGKSITSALAAVMPVFPNPELIFWIKGYNIRQAKLLAENNSSMELNH